MPIVFSHCRHFAWMALAVALVAPAACSAAPAAPAPQAEAFKPFVFILTGDPELGKPDVPSTAQRFALLPKRAAAIRASLVVIPGDLTHDDTDAEWSIIENTIKQFTMPVVIVPGNHDKPAAFAKHVGEDHYVFTLNNCDFVCVNTSVLDSLWGVSGKAKAHLAWLEGALKEARRRKRTHVFVVMHHPVADRKDISGLLARYGVKVVLAGHRHRTEEFPGKGFTTYVAPGTARFRDEGGLGYRVFKVYKDRVEQEFVPLEKEVSAVELKE